MSGLAETYRVVLARVPGLGREVRLLGDLRALWSLWRLCRRFRPDIVHTHTAKAGTLGRLAALLAGVPIRVHTFHGHVFRGYFARWKTSIYILVERLLARFTTRIVAISRRQADELRRYLKVDTAKVVVIPLGLDLSRFVTTDAAAARRRFRDVIGADDEVVVTMVGRLTAIKNHPMALRAIASLGRSQSDMVLALVGGGEEERALRTLVRELGIEGRVRFAGWWQDLAAVYYGSDIVALSSNNEGTPVSIIEALACERPVIATDVGGVADVLEDGRLGLLVPQGNVEAFAAALRRFSSASERARYARRGRSVVLERYGITRLIADIEALYDELRQLRGISTDP